MKNREKQYKDFIQERENLLSDLRDFGFDLYNKLIETNVPIREQLNRLSYYMNIEDYLNEELKNGYIYLRF